MKLYIAKFLSAVAHYIYKQRVSYDSSQQQH